MKKRAIGVVSCVVALGLVWGGLSPASAADSKSGGINCMGTSKTHSTGIRAGMKMEIKHTQGVNSNRWTGDSGVFATTVYKNWGMKSGTWYVYTSSASGFAWVSNVCEI